MDLTSTIAAAWGWVGLEPRLVVDENDFGNLIVEDVKGRFWRICPEELYCRLVADTRSELDAMASDQAFSTRLVHGRSGGGSTFESGFPSPRVQVQSQGAVYLGRNPTLRTTSRRLPLRELVSFSGDVARQIEGVPEGAQVKFTIKT